MKIEAGAYTSKGPVRQHNEDAFLIASESGGGGTDDMDATFSGTLGEYNLLFLVADGMGGHAAGDIASAFVSETLRNIAEGEQSINGNTIEQIIKDVHAKLRIEGKQRGSPTMGSTLAGIALQNSERGFFNVGDSRVYRLRNGFLQQLSHDDSLSTIVPGAAKNIITNAIGAGLSEISVESRFSPSVAVAGDIFLMCSDGVHGFVSEDELEQTLMSCSNPPVKTARLIVEKAIANGSNDNCTAVVVQIENQGK